MGELRIATIGTTRSTITRSALGEIADVPRVLDTGQCNDLYFLIVIAHALAQAFGVSVNELPFSYDIAWYEQKAVIVLLALLALGVRKIRLGPALPAFLSPNVLEVLLKAYELKPIADAEQDVQAMLAGN